MSKLTNKWVGEFDSLAYFFEDNIKTWTIDYVNLNNNISTIVCEAREEIIEIEKEIFLNEK